MKKILLIATGGTIASRQTGGGLAPQISPNELLRYLPDTSLCKIETAQAMNLDSTNINPEHWLTLSRLIEENYTRYDGFVICHGTDTLAYTASALSYLIQNANKPIVLTGAQRPIDVDITDAKTNLSDSLTLACSDMQGVCLVFDGHVIAGTRARKMRSKSYNAFSSINFPDLATIRDNKIFSYIKPDYNGRKPLFFHTLNTRVFLLKLIPGLSPEAFSVLGNLCDGLIIESFGVGGIPDHCFHALSELIEQGKTIVMATQVPREGSDLSVYQVGNFLKNHYHLLESSDMTLESTVTKLMWVLGQTKDKEEIKRLFQSSIHYDLLCSPS